MLKRLVLISSALTLVVAPSLAQDPPPPPGAPQVILAPPPDVDKPDDVGEPPGDPEGDAEWLSSIFFHMMDTNGDGVLSEEELSAWVLKVDMPMHDHDHGEGDHPEDGDPGDGGDPGDDGMPGMPGDPQLVPASPTVFWDFDEFVGILSDNVVIINFDALPSGPAVPTDFNLDKSLAGTMRTGMEWEDLGAIFYSPIGMSLRTVSTIEHYPPPHMDDPMVDLFVSRPNSLSIGAAPYTPELSAGDNNGVVDNNDDSLIIELTSPRAAVGFYLIDQDPGGDPPPPGEGIVFKDVNGNVIEHVQPLPSAIYPDHQFIGLMSFGQSIKTIEIDESDDADSYTIDHVVLSQ